MTFPQTPLDATVEIFVDEAWEDITSYVYVGDGIEVRYGQSDEASETEPASCSLTLNNRDGRFSPRNPVGPYYGSLGRNTPARVKVDLGSPRFVKVGSTASFETPDSAALSVTGDLDLRYFGYAADWGVGSSILMRKANVVDDSSWSFETSETFGLILYWTEDGSTFKSAWTNLPAAQRSGAQCLRVTLDVDNGASGRTVTFYSGPTIDGPWDQLGPAVVQSGTTSVFDSAQKVFANALDLHDEVFALQVRDGIDGTAVANPDFTIQTPGATSFDDAAGNTWSIVGSGAAITSERIRFFGEVSSWPLEWDVSQVDVRAKVVGAGPLRRLAQGEPIQSAYRRAVTGRAGDLLAYWPMEDGDVATSFGAGLDTHGPGTWTGDVNPGAYSGFVCSDAIATIDGGVVTFVPPQSPLTAFSVRALISIPEDGIAAAGSLCRVELTGTLGAVDVLYLQDGGDLNVLIYDDEGFLVDSSGIVDWNVDGTSQLYLIEAWQDGADVLVSLIILAPGGAPSQGLPGGEIILAGQTLTGVSRVILNDGAWLSGHSVGHVTLQTTDPYPDVRELDDSLDAYTGELAGARYDRLLEEQGVTGVSCSGLDTEAVGVQKRGSFLTLLQDAARADDAILAERRHDGSLMFRSRFSMYDQYPALTLPYELLQRLGPVDDDYSIHNDVTVVREGGASSRAIREDGSLSISEVGLYEAQVTLSLAADVQTENQAYWRLARGTIDESRYPGIEFDLAAPDFASDPDLLAAVLSLIPGDLLVITDPPSFAGSPDDVAQIVLGVTEKFDQFGYHVVVNCTPAFPFLSTRLNDETTRAGASDSTLVGALDSTATSFDVDSGSGVEWVNSTDDASAFPLDVFIGGERMTVSAISVPTGTVQTFTVTRSVNGVVKAHDAAAPVQVADILRLAL